MKIFIYTLLVVSAALYSCSAPKRMQRLITNHPELLNQDTATRVNTTTIIDTFENIITKHTIDSVFVPVPCPDIKTNSQVRQEEKTKRTEIRQDNKTERNEDDNDKKEHKKTEDTKQNDSDNDVKRNKDNKKAEVKIEKANNRRFLWWLLFSVLGFSIRHFIPISLKRRKTE